jgi:hypothetical protein
MECPVSLEAEDIRNEKVKLLQCVEPIQLDNVVTGQYRCGTLSNGTKKEGAHCLQLLIVPFRPFGASCRWYEDGGSTSLWLLVHSLTSSVVSGNVGVRQCNDVHSLTVSNWINSPLPSPAQLFVSCCFHRFGHLLLLWVRTRGCPAA